MADSKTKQVTISFQNFDQISKKLILTRFNKPGYQIEVIADAMQADVCFYNQEQADEGIAIEALVERLKTAEIPLIVLTELADWKETDLITVIHKPIRNRNLSEYLFRVKDAFYVALKVRMQRKNKQKSAKLIYNTHLSNAINPEQIRFETNRYYAQKYVGLNTDIDFDEAGELHTVLFNPENYFFHYLGKGFLLSQKKKKPACIKTVYGTFFVNAQDKIIYHDKSADEIVNIHKIPFYKDTQVFIPKLRKGRLDNLYPFDYEPFVWLSSINASKGKIPQDTNFNAPVKITAWPDLTKLIVFKHAMRIISLWSRGVYSLRHTARLLDIPQRYPLTVYTAMHALGLITEVKKR
ncbi:hypothetical protein OS175_12535 [Marinicella sp. S1101]|uniref:hypothetical protein n=1 Tax=Marinicella marina TaxID=2996016 RepID=UPI002260B636|nr:hypothetical protein [Marinicella marina]MCX7554709.1 hypothetical protein [Marinicella marina]MDJ1141475.1 hypothetical protein [Marinicella marina]